MDTNDSSRNTHLRPKSTTVRVGGIHAVADDGTVLLQGVNVTLEAGTMTALCGQSGSGKSTLLRALNQIRQQQILVTIADEGCELEKLPKAFQQQNDTIAFGKLSPAEYLMLTAKIYGTSEARFRKLYIFTVGLFETSKKGDQSTSNNPFLDGMIMNLSGGQQRVLSIVSALLLDPKLLLLDKPLSGLDAFSYQHVMDAIKFVAEQRSCTILLIVHQPSKAILQYFDQLICLEAGMVAFARPVHQTKLKIGTNILNQRLSHKLVAPWCASSRRLSSLQQGVGHPFPLLLEEDFSPTDSDESGDNVSSVVPGTNESTPMTASESVPVRRVLPEIGDSPLAERVVCAETKFSKRGNTEKGTDTAIDCSNNPEGSSRLSGEIGEIRLDVSKEQDNALDNHTQLKEEDRKANHRKSHSLLVPRYLSQVAPIVQQPLKDTARCVGRWL